jgi:hypothetical protein
VQNLLQYYGPHDHSSHKVKLSEINKQNYTNPFQGKMCQSTTNYFLNQVSHFATLSTQFVTIYLESTFTIKSTPLRQNSCCRLKYCRCKQSPDPSCALSLCAYRRPVHAEHMKCEQDVSTSNTRNVTLLFLSRVTATGAISFVRSAMKKSSKRLIT